MSRKMYRNVEKRGVQRAFRVTKRRDLYDLLATLLLPPPRQPEIEAEREVKVGTVQ